MPPKRVIHKRPAKPAPKPVTTEEPELPRFNADAFLYSWSPQSLPQHNNFRAAIEKAFDIDPTSDYVYQAGPAQFTLPQVQVAIDHGSMRGLHAFYQDEQGRQSFTDDNLLDPPSPADIEAYIQIFSPTTSTTKALTALSSNAKKGSLRAFIAEHLQSKLVLPPPNSSTKVTLPAKGKAPTITNPYYDIWSWSCFCLEWGGPERGTERIGNSHHILPVLYNHFGCVCPSGDALSIIHQLASTHSTTKRPVVEIGSGNGYWTFLLRKLGLTVYAVDNQHSLWRTMWIHDTIIKDGVKFLTGPPKDLPISPGERGCSDAILLLVYPQVSNDFTGKVIRAYGGDTVVVAGTQNGNGYTGFKDEQIDAWMARERPAFRKIMQIPLPSFAAKDEALFVFCKKKD